jgi:hypothetical protein
MAAARTGIPSSAIEHPISGAGETQGLDALLTRLVRLKADETA